MEALRARRERLLVLEARVRRENIEAGNPLGRVAFLLVFFGELAVRWLLGQETAEAWTLPLLHGLLAWFCVALVCAAVAFLYRLTFRPQGRGGEADSDR